MNLLQWFKEFLEEPKDEVPEYKIVHDPILGYIPLYKYRIHGWCIIEEDNTIGATLAMATKYPYKWCKTEEEAGKRINMHATNRGQKVIWPKEQP